MEFRYSVNDYLSAGAYLRYDLGNRQESMMNIGRHGFEVIELVNADYNELWIGPIVKGHYKDIFLGLGYGLLASRNDEFIRIPRFAEIVEKLTTSSIAWLVQLGGNFELNENFELSIMVEYRVRYYDKFEGTQLIDDFVIGTQNFTPLVGVNYNYDL